MKGSQLNVQEFKHILAQIYEYTSIKLFGISFHLQER